MKRFRDHDPRIIGAVGLTVVAALVLGAFKADVLTGLTATTYRAAFRDASGLAPGNEVRVAGVRVGKVTAVELARGGTTPAAGPSGSPIGGPSGSPAGGSSGSPAGGAGASSGGAAAAYVRVTFRLEDDGVRLGRATRATIRIKTVLGQKYLALEPAGDGRLAEGAEIPLDRTAAPFDVVEAVSGLAETLDQIDSSQLADAFTTLAQAFADTPGSVQASLDGLSRLSKTVSDRDEQLRALLARAHEVTGVLAARDEEFRKLVADGDALLTEVRRRRDAIHDLLVGTNALAAQLAGVVADNKDRLGPALQQLRGVVGILQRNRDNLDQTLQRMGPFVAAFANVTGNGRWFDSYLAGLLQPYLPATGGQ